MFHIEYVIVYTVENAKEYISVLILSFHSVSVFKLVALCQNYVCTSCSCDPSCVSRGFSCSADRVLVIRHCYAMSGDILRFYMFDMYVYPV